MKKTIKVTDINKQIEYYKSAISSRLYENMSDIPMIQLNASRAKAILYVLWVCADMTHSDYSLRLKDIEDIEKKAIKRITERGCI